MIGLQLGRYRITAPLGAGGMGDVLTITIGWQSAVGDEHSGRGSRSNARPR
jgi:hypothetical protein